ncbi:substrate-binding periplasmic protein [Bdellovibrio sp. HCB290]|uniref:substrate-binding periplasmic protein n=1 Tax=Bdellovibrio sp. HCB290 TaxID=3394356 RepID=UPI0039B50699
MRTAILIFLILILGKGAWCSTKSVTYAGYNNPPYYMLDGSSGITGAFFEIMTHVCTLEKFNCKFTIRPIREALEKTQAGEVDIAGPFGWTSHRQLSFYYSPPLFDTSFTFFGLEKNVRNIKTYEDLKGLRIGTVAPSLSMISLQKINEVLNGKIKIVEEKEPVTSLKMTLQNSYPLAYINREMALYWVREKKSKLVEVPDLGESFSVHIIFSKKLFSKDEFTRIQKRFNELIDNKTIETIGKKYNLKPAAATVPAPE